MKLKKQIWKMQTFKQFIDASAEKFFGGVVQTNSTQSAKICPNLHFGGGGWWFRTNIPEILECPHSSFFEPNFQPLQLATASQIVSHILCIWRLTSALLNRALRL